MKSGSNKTALLHSEAAVNDSLDRLIAFQFMLVLAGPRGFAYSQIKTAPLGHLAFCSLPLWPRLYTLHKASGDTSLIHFSLTLPVCPQYSFFSHCPLIHFSLPLPICPSTAFFTLSTDSLQSHSPCMPIQLFHIVHRFTSVSLSLYAPVQLFHTVH